jgi:O-antigen ligase
MGERISLGIGREEGAQWLQPKWFPFLLVFLAFALGVLAAVISPYTLVLILVLVVVSSLALLNFEATLLIALAIRPCLDWKFFQNNSFYRTTAGVGLDMAAMLNLLITFIGLLYILAHKINIFKTSVSKVALAFICICASTTIISSNRVLTLAQTTIVISFFVIYVVFFTVIRSRKQVNCLLAVYLLAAIAPAVVAIYQIFTSELTYRATGLPRVNGGLTSNASLGEFLVLPLTVAVVLFLQPQSLIRRIGYGILAVFFAVPFFFSQTRTPWAGFVLILLILAFFRYRKLLLLISVVLIILWLLVPAVSLRFSDVSFKNPETSTLGVRLQLWSAAIDLFNSSPLVGVGFGVADSRTGFMAFGKQHPVHNTYLRVLADTGIVGFIAYWGLLFSFLWEAAVSYRKLHNPFYRTLVVGFAALCAALMWQRIWGNQLTTSIRQFYFWSYAALVPALVWVERRELHQNGNDEKGGVDGS